MTPGFFVNPQVELLTAKAVLATVAVFSFALGVILLIRFQKTKVKKSLLLGLNLIALPPLLSTFMFELEKSWLAQRMAPQIADRYNLNLDKYNQLK